MEDMYDPLHNPLRGYIEVEVRDREGRIVGRGRHEMRSFLNNLLRILVGFMNSKGTLVEATLTPVVKTDGTTANAKTEVYQTNVPFEPVACKAPDNADSYGIVVGSSTTSISLENYNLVSKIPHGTGSGQLDYGVVDYTDLGLDTGVSPPVYRFRLLRPFTNLSGGAISINEVGIIARNATSTIIDYLIARDVLPSTYTVPNGGTATVAITVEVVVG
jgi:hypothetical protein